LRAFTLCICPNRAFHNKLTQFKPYILQNGLNPTRSVDCVVTTTRHQCFQHWHGSRHTSTMRKSASADSHDHSYTTTNISSQTSLTSSVSPAYINKVSLKIKHLGQRNIFRIKQPQPQDEGTKSSSARSSSECIPEWRLQRLCGRPAELWWDIWFFQ
jgi:hypothetical protein